MGAGKSDCKWCQQGDCWSHGDKGKSGGKGGVLQSVMKMLSAKGGKSSGKGKGKSRGGIICSDMKKSGSCPRGDDCKWCKKMIEKFGTNDPNDQTCWNMTMKGECKAGDKCKYTH